MEINSEFFKSSCIIYRPHKNIIRSQTCALFVCDTCKGFFDTHFVGKIAKVSFTISGYHIYLFQENEIKTAFSKRISRILSSVYWI